jgi:hypothetical protein
MKFKIVNAKYMKNPRVHFTRSGKNLFIQVCYDGLTALWPTSAYITAGSFFWVTIEQENPHKRKPMMRLELIPETPEEKRFLQGSYYGFVLSSDYCDTQIVLTPTLKSQQWDKVREAKLVS